MDVLQQQHQGGKWTEIFWWDPGIRSHLDIVSDIWSFWQVLKRMYRKAASLTNWKSGGISYGVSWILFIKSVTTVPPLLWNLTYRSKFLPKHKLLVGAQLYENLLNQPMKPFHLLLRLLCALSGIIPASSRILFPTLWSMTGHFTSVYCCFHEQSPYGQDITSNADRNALILCSFDALRTKDISFTSKSHKNWVQVLILWFFFLHFQGFNIFM